MALINSNELIDIIKGNEEFTDWQKEEIKECIDACDVIQENILNLPCKVGDILYGTMLKELNEYKVFAINIGMRKQGSSCVIFAHNHRNATVNFELIDFNKTVFLTRAEAEKHLQPPYITDEEFVNYVRGDKP